MKYYDRIIMYLDGKEDRFTWQGKITALERDGGNWSFKVNGKQIYVHGQNIVCYMGVGIDNEESQRLCKTHECNEEDFYEKP